MNQRSATVECTIPILKVENLATSLEFYENVLGFERGWRYEKDSFAMAGISRDHCAIYLTAGAQGNSGTWIWIGVSDIQPLAAEFQARGANIVMPPTNFSWAYEMRVRDPDGHVLRFGSQSLSGVPVSE